MSLPSPTTVCCKSTATITKLEQNSSLGFKGQMKGK
jgi:hypothetical protein